MNNSELLGATGAVIAALVCIAFPPLAIVLFICGLAFKTRV